ncbi:hypothetical protein A6A19_07880 [Actinobacillus delphinicola]|uniref:integrating conjugative element protein n=1 Tax=Actinobacillus delphinicola TaxID=51161 RepID=UPI0024424D6C|nr:integrating conjugative element protein [Actinobacillus delphinicola]MDG6897892.1 hypothetical protein [Actinobacillus delphinicola]
MMIFRMRKFKIHKIRSMTLAVTGLLGTQYAVAGDYNYQHGAIINDYVNYTIGGGNVIHPMASSTHPERLNVGVAWNSDLMCGNLDFNKSIINDLQGQAKNSIMSLYNNIVSSAKGAIASMPALMLQRSNPQLYDMLTNGAYQASLDFSNIKTSCEALGNKMADYAENSWKNLGKDTALTEMLSNNQVTAKNFQERKENAQRQNQGIKWVGGEKKGGVGQQSIQTNKDAATAGYNVIQNRQPTDKSNVSQSQCTGRICQVWRNPNEASQWVTDVVGDEIVSTCSGSNGKQCGDQKEGTKVGKGLTPKIIQEAEEVKKKFNELFNKKEPPTTQELEDISSSTVKVTRGLLEAIKESPNQSLLVSKLSTEIGLSRALEKALLARRMLIASMREPNIAAAPNAIKTLERSLTLLDRDIGQVKLELEMNQLLGTKTALTALQQVENDKMKRAIPNQAENTNKLQNLDKSSKENREIVKRYSAK